MAFHRGDIVLLPFPFTDLSARKVRPTVVLSSASYHATEPDLILGAITTNLTAATASVDYVLVDWQSANLRFPPLSSHFCSLCNRRWFSTRSTG